MLRFIDPLTYLALHRGITHSIVLLPMWAVGLAFFFMLIARRRYSLQPFAGVCALGIAVHIISDVITSFDTMLFAPFSIWRAQLPTTFIIDPYFTSILVAGLIAFRALEDTAGTGAGQPWNPCELRRLPGDLAPTRCRGWKCICRRAASRVRAGICTSSTVVAIQLDGCGVGRRCRSATVPAAIGWTHRGKSISLSAMTMALDGSRRFPTKKGAARSTDDLAGSDTMGPVILRQASISF
jgi:membrane-bound metal-dependent hydrolase YbcI (DUF457 family)